jgi:hypothetical protein
MTTDREREVMAHIPTLASLDEATAFRRRLSEQGEQMTATVLTALRDRMDLLAKREGRA